MGDKPASAEVTAAMLFAGREALLSYEDQFRAEDERIVAPMLRAVYVRMEQARRDPQAT